MKSLIFNLLYQRPGNWERKIPLFLNRDGSFPDECDRDRPTRSWDGRGGGGMRSKRVPSMGRVHARIQYPRRGQGKEAVRPLTRFQLVVGERTSPCRCCSVSTGRCSASVITGSAFVSTPAPSFSALSQVNMSQFHREQVTGSQRRSLQTKSPNCRSLNWRAHVLLL